MNTTRFTYVDGELQHDGASDVEGEYVKAEVARALYDALDGIISIGKRDLSNPKYDAYFDEAKKVLLKTN